MLLLVKENIDCISASKELIFQLEVTETLITIYQPCDKPVVLQWATSLEKMLHFHGIWSTIFPTKLALQ